MSVYATGPHATVLLDVDQVRELRDALTAWLAAEATGWFEVRRQADRGGL